VVGQGNQAQQDIIAYLQNELMELNELNHKKRAIEERDRGERWLKEVKACIFKYADRQKKREELDGKGAASVDERAQLMQFYEIEDIIRKLQNIEAILNTDTQDDSTEKSPEQLELAQLKRRIT